MDEIVESSALKEADQLPLSLGPDAVYWAVTVLGTSIGLDKATV
jgi:hypothetical protein